jgi:hypothetical protein
MNETGGNVKWVNVWQQFCGRPWWAKIIMIGGLLLFFNSDTGIDGAVTHNNIEGLIGVFVFLLAFKKLHGR